MRDAVAIIGSGARFPGAVDHVDFRRMVAGGGTHASEIPSERWDHAQVHSPNPRHANKTPAKKAAFMHDIEGFAPEFFGVTPKRAKLMDPQQRLVLEIARHALEDAGYAKKSLADGRVGVYVGVSSVDHRLMTAAPVNMPLALAGRFGTAARLSEQDAAAVTGALPSTGAYSMPGSQLNMIAANVSQAFDFRGPAFTVDTACSSALTALHEAVCHLRAGTVNAAVAGGVYVLLDPVMMVCFSRIGALSPTDVCAPFQTAASGFVLGEGTGLVVLKRLADAQRDGDRIVAVIRGIGINNDGRGQGPLTPSDRGQAEAIRLAWEDAGCDPSTVGMLEAHATATAAGDRSELRALSSVFAGRTKGRVPISSIKANVGHGLSSAGAASLLKAVYAVESGVLPGQPVYGPLREEFSGEHGWLRLADRSEKWATNEAMPRRAGVSAFGFGGTNVHVVIEQAPLVHAVARKENGYGYRMVVSAPNHELLLRYAGELARAIRETRPAAVDVAFTLASRRADVVAKTFGAKDTDELIGQLEHMAHGGEVSPDDSVETEDGRLVSLPPSPLLERRFSILDRSKLSKAAVQTTGSAEPVSEDSSIAALDAKDLVVGAVCAVTAWRPEEISPSQRLVADLGFDSLTTVEFMAFLGKGLKGIRPPPRTMFTPALTIDELVTWIQDAHAEVPRSEDARTFVFTTRTHPWLLQHRPAGVALLPLAAMVEAAQSLLTTGTMIEGFRLSAPLEVTGDRVVLRLEQAASGEFTLWSESGIQVATATVAPASERAPGLSPGASELRELNLGAFYSQAAFHGPALQGLSEKPSCAVDGARGQIAGKGDSVRFLDGALQLALYWLATERNKSAVVTGFDRFTQWKRWPEDGKVECVAKLVDEEAGGFSGDFDFLDGDGYQVAQWRGVVARLLPTRTEKSSCGILPEVVELAGRKAALAKQGFSMPYFRVLDGVAGATTSIAGRAFINFSSYNYLGFSGHAAVNAAAVEAIARYGTSASASRVASGERPLHAELEGELAVFLGCESALATVSGHSINVSLIGHLLGPEDLVVHDSLAHDSIVTGARLSGARRLAFPHNDMVALDALLAAERPKARRALIAVEGVYSMDGDLAPLAEVIALKKKHDALLLVDEAHSLGVIGKHGAGAGEYFDVKRTDVDLWMGTLSKALASCGGYVAGEAALIDYLKFTMPGFVYSVGLSPANAAASLAALRLLRRDSAAVARLQERSDFFRAACRAQGVDIGASAASAVVPCITGSSKRALRLAQELAYEGVNVQPVFYPAVEEGRARLRFFITADHTEAQLSATADLLGARLRLLEEEPK